MVIKSIALVAFTAALSSSVNAAIISVDWQSAGDNLITEDTVNGLQWLDLTVTSGISYNAVVAQMGSGGTYEGWSYATTTEIEGFFGEFGGNGPYIGSTQAHNVMFDNGLLDIWGATIISASAKEAYFIIGEEVAPNTRNIGYLLDYVDNATYGDYVSVNVQTWSDDSVYPSVGSALVRSASPSVVPIPAAAWLFGSGLLGLIGVARRKARA